MEPQAPEPDEYNPPPELMPEFPPERNAPVPSASSAGQAEPSSGAWPCTWENFVAFCSAHLAPDGPLNMGHLRQIKGRCLETELVLDVESQTAHTMFNIPTRLECLRRMVTELAGRPVTVRLAEPSRIVIPEATLREEAKTHPAVRLMMEEFDASVNRCIDMNENTVSHG